MLASACSDSHPPPTGTSISWFLSATVSGAADFVAQPGQAAHNGTVLTITGLQSAEPGRRALDLRVDGVSGAGTYDLTAGSSFALYGETGVGVIHSWSVNSEQGSGSISVSELSDSAVVAAFSFVAPASGATGASGIKQVVGSAYLPLTSWP